MPQADMLGPVIRALTTVPIHLLGMVKDFIHKITGADSTIWIDQARSFLQKKPCWVKITEVAQVVKKTLTPFFTITTGGTTADQLIADIKANKNENKVADEVSDYAKSMMANQTFTVSTTSGTANLVSLTIAELGFTEQPRTDEFMTAKFCATWSAEHLDGQAIELCQPEDGPQLRKQWNDQPKGIVVWMAMERIADSDDNPRVFRVARRSDGVRWLDGDWACVGGRWSPDSRIVFRLRKTL